MKIISYNNARVTWLFPLEEVLPIKRKENSDLYELVAQRYSFKNRPSINITPEEMAKNGLRFSEGIFKYDDEYYGIIDIHVYNDGVIVSSPTTEISSAILADLMTWLREEHDFRDFVSPVRELSLSEVIVEFDYPLAGLLSASLAIAQAVTSIVGPMMETPASMDFARLEFAFDLTNPQVKALPRSSLLIDG